MQNMTRIVLTGGVSGGHTYPLVAVAREIRHQVPDAQFLFLGPKGKFEVVAMREEGITARYLITGKWRRYFSFLNFVDLFRIPIGFLQSLWHLFWFMPDAVFSKGGSASVPVVVAAWLYRIPILLHDSDAKSGAANRFCARFATRVAIAYENVRADFPASKIALTGNPVRQEMMQGDVARGIEAMHLRIDLPTILVIGGSQGAQAINRHILEILPALLEQNIQVVHQTGESNLEGVVRAVTDFGINVSESLYRPVGFMDAQTLADMYQVAQVVVSRAGAGSISELAANKKASVLIPLPSAANDEQRLNAYEIQETGGAIVVEEKNLTEHVFLEVLQELLHDGEKRELLGERLAAFYHPDAEERIAQALLDMTRQ